MNITQKIENDDTIIFNANVTDRSSVPATNILFDLKVSTTLYH